MEQDKDTNNIQLYRELVEVLKNQLECEKEEANYWRKQATMLLTHQHAQPEPVNGSTSLLEKRFGKRT